MQVPLEISFRGTAHAPEIDELIRSRAAKLERVGGDIVSCRVTVEHPQEHQRQGNPHRVRVEVSMPRGKHLVVTRDPVDEEMHAPLETVVRSAFDAMERRLKEAVAKRRHHVKVHDEPRAFVARLFPGEGYGFLTTPDGRELYFHKNGVLHGDFERLAVGTEVRFAEHMGEKGPQASSIQIESKPGAREATSQ